MGELLLKKAIACRDRIAKLRAALPGKPEDITKDEHLEAYISFGLFLLIQDAVDLAAHLIAARGLGVPSSQRESFEILARAGVISSDSAVAMASMTAVRNRIAHAYGEIDPVRIAREAPAGLRDVERFLGEVAQAAAAATG